MMIHYQMCGCPNFRQTHLILRCQLNWQRPAFQCVGMPATWNFTCRSARQMGQMGPCNNPTCPPCWGWFPGFPMNSQISVAKWSIYTQSERNCRSKKLSFSIAWLRLDHNFVSRKTLPHNLGAPDAIELRQVLQAGDATGHWGMGPPSKLG